MMHSNIAIALDFQKKEDAIRLVNQLDPSRCILKVGLQMYTLFGSEWIEYLLSKGFEVFLDLKLHDIPNTVAEAVRAASELGVSMLTLHTLGGARMLDAAREANANSSRQVQLLGVTLLTSFSSSDFMELYQSRLSMDDFILSLANLASRHGMDGVICSAHEVQRIKSICGQHFLCVTPGIRLDKGNHDQQRVATPQYAVGQGSDCLVIGRAITESTMPSQTLKTIQISINR